MNRLLKSPTVNVVFISFFTAFYALVFFIASKSVSFENSLYDKKADSFWRAWCGFLATGNQRYIACVLIAVTVLVVILLITRRRTYDEYHTSILANCLLIAAILVLVAIAVFYLLILNDPSGITEKFTLFIVIHWTTVVFANLVFVLLCRRK